MNEKYYNIVSSFLYEDLPEPDRWFRFARAYIKSSHKLSEEILLENVPRNFFQGSVVFFTLLHSIELFLKGGIRQAGENIQSSHQLDELCNILNNLYPGKEYEFNGSIEKFVKKDKELPYEQFLKYPTDSSGKEWKKPVIFDMDLLFDESAKFIEDFERLEKLYKKKYPNKEST